MSTNLNQNRMGTGVASWNQDAESLFRLKSISEIRNIEAATRKQIQDKSEELRQLVGSCYRDLIDSADSIVHMESTCRSISNNISGIHHAILYSISSPDIPRSPRVSSDSVGARTYGIACRVKYLVDTPENIWGCLDESMFFESSARYMRAKYVHYNLLNCKDSKNVLSNFPLLQHQWQIVESFKVQISQRSQDRLLDHNSNLDISVYADALAAVAVIEELEPKQVLTLFLDSRKSIMSQKLSACCRDAHAGSLDVISVFCDVLKIVQVTVCQVGELFLQILNDMPLFYKTVLDTPPVSQLFGGIPNPEEEIRLWTLFKDKLESDMVLLDQNFISTNCSEWLKDCGKHIMSEFNGRHLIDVIGSGYELSLAEKSIRDTMNNKQVLEGSLEWLKSVFGSEIELPWKHALELVLGENSDIWNDIFEEAFVQRMKAIVESQFSKLSSAVDVVQSVRSIVKPISDSTDSEDYFKKYQNAGSVWFMNSDNKKFPSTPASKSHQPLQHDLQSYFSSYLGPEVSHIKEAVDQCCKNVLEDLLSFLDSPNAPFRLKDFIPFVQNKCHGSLSAILAQLKLELENLYSEVQKESKDATPGLSSAVLVERSIFIGRLMLAFQKHARHIFVILGPPRSWVSEDLGAVGNPSSFGFLQGPVVTELQIIGNLGRKIPDSSRKRTSLLTASLFGIDDNTGQQLEELRQIIQELSLKAYNLWILCVSDEASNIFSRNLKDDNALSSSSPVRGWEEIVVKQQDQSSEGQSDIRISLPSMPSLYVTSFLFYACGEIHRVGGHVLDKQVLQNFASVLFDKFLGTYEDFVSNNETCGSPISEKGALQILFDLKFVADILSGENAGHANDESLENSKTRSPFRRKHKIKRSQSISEERTNKLISCLSEKLDPIDWLTYEPYLWENEKQAYLRHGVLCGFFVQLNRIHVNIVQKLPTNSDSNIMRCSKVPRFKYLPISAPALSTRNATGTPVSPTVDDIYSRNSRRSLKNDELSRNSNLNDDSSLSVAAPFLKSFMQVGSRFGESTLRLGSILADGQVGRFGEILPSQAAGLLSSLKAARSDS